MDKNRDSDRPEKSRSSGIPHGMDPVTAALYAPWLQTEQALLSNMLGAGGLGAYAAAAAMQGMGGAGMHPQYPPVSSSANLASIAAAQQAQAQAAILASMGPSTAAAWYNLAGMQQMELVSRLQGGVGGLGAGPYAGIHPEHLMNLELLQAQHAAMTAAALSGGSGKSTGPSRTSSNSSSNSSIAAGRSTTPTSSKVPRSSPSSSRMTSSHRSSRDHLASLVASRSAAKEAERNSKHSNDSSISVRSDLGASGSSGLSYRIASLMSDKPPASKSASRPPSVSTPSEAIRSKELEIIPLSKNSIGSNGVAEGSVLAAHLSSKPYPYESPKKDSLASLHSLMKKEDKKVRTSNGLSLGPPQVSIEPLMPRSDDGPVDLSLKPTSSKNQHKNDKTQAKDATELLSKLKPPNPYDYAQGLGIGLLPDMAPSLEVLQSLYKQGHSRDILASMQDALQRQLIMADPKKRDDRKKRPRSNSGVDDMPREERARHLGRGVSKPKKNTVASLLEHCRAAGIKPQLPLPSDTPISSASTGVTNSPPRLSSPISPKSKHESHSPAPETPPVQLPPSLLPLFTSAPSYGVSPVPPSTTPSPSSLSSLLSSTSSTPSLSFPLSLPSSLSISTSPATNTSDQPKESHRVQITPVSSQKIDSRPASVHKEVKNSLEMSDDSESELSSSSDDEQPPNYIQPWLNNDSDGHSRQSASPPTKKRKMITDESSLRVPLLHGWKRETSMRGITQSGVRGEVVYIAPCGKLFKQYPDIIRYLERQNITEITRDNFSFSSKIPVGDYIDATTQQAYTEAEIREIVNNIRTRKGLKTNDRHHKSESESETSKLSRDALEVEAEAILRRLEAEEQAEKAKKDLIHRLEEHSLLSSRAWKEQEKIKKQEELRKEKEEQRKQREEINRQRLYEQLRKAQEREQEKQKQKLLKEQERERRRYHSVLVRTLEARKRYEEREKKREFVREEKKASKEKKKEERQAARELNLLLKEVKEDMELTDHQPLPEVPPLKGLKLPPEAFGNVLMIFEFLNNFGETLGFDMDSLPSLQSLQLALLGDHESEEELLNVISHLMVCAIEDPGIPNSQRNTTILNQTLNKADIVSTNISEILRVYLYANATGEVRIIHGLHGTEKERRETPSKGQEWEDRLLETEAYRMSKWLQKLPFTSLTATQKGTIVAYVCNELLQNKAVVHQIEDSLDRHNGLKTHKWKLDARIRSLCRRLKMGNRKRFNAHMRTNVDSQKGDDSNLSAPSWIEDKEDDEEHADDSGAESDAGTEEPHDEEEDSHLNADEATKALESLQKQMDDVRQELFETAQQVRGYNCGQDRYQRTMWVLPHAGGPFLEGLNSCDYTGRDHFPLTIPESCKKTGLTYEESQTVKRKREERRKEEEEENAKKLKTEEPMKEVNGTPPPQPKEEAEPIKTETKEDVEKDLVATGLGLIPGQYLRPEHVAQCEKLSFDIIPKFGCTVMNSCSEESSPAPPGTPFSPCTPNGSTPLTSMTPLLQQSLQTHHMSHKELLEKLHQSAEALPIPTEFKDGWWNITDLELLKEMAKSFNERGARERELRRFIERNFNIVKNAISKVDPNIMNFDETIEDETLVLYDESGIPVQDNANNWQLDEALRVDLLALDTVLALEEKITNASMQNKNWKLRDVNLKQKDFLPSCMCLPEDKDEEGNSLLQTMSISDDWDIVNHIKNPIHIGRYRLLSLEEGIERRYLKPPLGQAVGVPAKGDCETKCAEPTRSLHNWQEAVAKCENAGQLNMCSYMLETAVAWDKSIMKAYCQFCHSGDYEEKLLLCDGCDKGYHMHCFKPPMEKIPEGDWYCYECVNKFSDSGHRHCLACGGVEGKNLIHCVSCPRAYHTTCLQPPLNKIPRSKWNCPACATKSPRKRNRHPRKIAAEIDPNPVLGPPVLVPPTNGTTSMPVTPATGSPTSRSPEPVMEDAVCQSPHGLSNGPTSNPATPKKDKPIKKKDLKDLIVCKQILADLEAHEDAWPFLLPVNTRQFPTYKKVIKKPADLSTIKKKLEDSVYKCRDEYSEDIQLMFNNCEIFNEDDSPVGKAGHNLRSFFQAKWNDSFPPT